LRPNAIILQEKDLDDDHMEDLCKFMNGREMIKKINLRKNKIGDRGIIELAKFIAHQD
jgi:hypothetical protein